MEPFATIELETIAKEAEVPVLILPGLFGSGPEHWQGHWERENPHFKRIQQRNWYHPVLAEWIYAIELSATNAAQPPVMVAHSLGCIALAHWAERCAGRVAGAMLVAPPDIDRGRLSDDLSGFGPIPAARLPFPSIVVSSSNDPWCSIGRARAIAASWGARFVNAGACGHINVDSGFGPWPEGKALLNELLLLAHESTSARG